MVRYITYPLLVLLVAGLIAFSYIKGKEAELQTLLAQEMLESLKEEQARSQNSAAMALEEAARAEKYRKEAENQILIAQEQAAIAEQERFNANNLRKQLEACQNK